jgi:hypothetical protein
MEMRLCITISDLIKFTDESFSRDSGNVKLPFEIKISLPKPRKGRTIVKRDDRGRIIRSAVPEQE